MIAPTACLAAVVTCTAVGSADVYRVRNVNDSGTGSLRWAIQQANARAGRDRVGFASRLKGRTIAPTTALPAVTDDQTILDGDIDDDGSPDIAISGRKLSSGHGVEIVADRCVVVGLAITRFPLHGLRLNRATTCTVRSCHIGVNLAGTAAAHNGMAQIRLYKAVGNTLGGAMAGEGNVIAAGPGDHAAIQSTDSRRNTISGNLIGLARDGLTPTGSSGIGISLQNLGAGSGHNVVGGSTPGAGNVIASVGYGLWLSGASYTTVSGNLFGLAADGDAGRGIGTIAVSLTAGAHHNTIGGLSPAARNVFVGETATGVAIAGASTSDNVVQGNYFGSNAAGTKERRLWVGINVASDGGHQLIGGEEPGAANYFTPNNVSDTALGVEVQASSGAIQANVFGVLPNGTDTRRPIRSAIVVSGGTPDILGNTIAHPEFGVWVQGATARPGVFGNRFRNCEQAVFIWGNASCRLGNLANTRTDDDGGNVFRPSNTWHIYNYGPNRIRAEGNRFGTSSRSAIAAKIWDRRDDASLGLVDFIPLDGGVVPSGGTLSISSLAALPAGSGGQITFTLSSAAQVQARILNIAGRPVKTLCRAKDFEAGANTLLWNAQSDTGLPVPNGTYLVELSARSADGAQARALTQIAIRR